MIVSSVHSKIKFCTRPENYIVENLKCTGHLSPSLECMRRSMNDLSPKCCLLKRCLLQQDKEMILEWKER